MKHLITIFLLLFSFYLHAQMWNGQDSLYGNEWIRYDQSYYKLKVAEDAIYRLSYEQMQAAGIPLSEIQSQQFQLFHLGKEVPIYLSSEGLLNIGDFIEFYGEKNRSELDRHLFTNPDEDLLNPEFSLFTDSSAYFLTWVTDGSPTLRYTNLNNDLTDLPAAEPWYWAQEQVVFTEQHLKRYQKFSGANLYYSHFDGDGFGHPYTDETRISLPTPNRFSGGPKANVSINLMGNANAEGHALQIELNNEVIQSDTFYGTQIRKYRYEFAPEALSNEVELTVRGLNATDRYGVALGKIQYPSTFSFSKESVVSMELPAGNGSRYLELIDLKNENYFVLEPAGNLRAIVSKEQIHRLHLPARSGTRNLIWSTASAIKPIASITPITFLDFQPANSNYLILTSERLFDDGAGNNWVQAYADYRSSVDGGNFRTEIIEIQQLFDQFAYGIDFHPLSIRNGFNFLYANRLKALEYVFIIGRGQEYQIVRTPESMVGAIESADMLIPSFGYPASDNLLFTSNETVVSPVPIGRLAAKTGAEVKIYLEKVKAVESSKQLPQTITERAWTKHVLHLGGGSSSGEQLSIQNRLNAMAAEIEQSSFGGSVQSFFKNSTDVIQNSLSQEIFDYINRGTSMITFFGHSSPGTFDFNIDNPDNYENEGRYPLILSLGCYSGNIFGPSRSIGERFSFYDGKAAVAFAASRGLGSISALGSFATDFYQNIGEKFYGESIGKALHATYIKNDSLNWISMETLVEQFTLHGDPAIRLHPVEGPDYVIDAASVDFGSSTISSQMDSLNFHFDAINLGKNEHDTISLIISRTFPDGEKVELLKDTITMDQFRKPLQYTLAVGGPRSTGQNLFHVSIDADEQVIEYPNPAAEMNNELTRSNGELGIPLFIIDNTARAVYPPEFALIGDPDITLKASTTNALAPERTYWLEVDTTALFSSPLKVRLTQQQRGGVLKWTPNINWQDHTVYYWRVSPAVSPDNPEPVWSNSSFTYIAGSEPGWRQGHYWQFKENTETDLIFTDSTQTVSFGQELLDMRVRNKLWDRNDPPGFFYNNDNPAVSVRPWRYLNQGISVVVFEPNNGAAWRNSGKQYGSIDNAGNFCFSFDTRNSEQRIAFMNFLKNDVPDQYIVFVFTIQANAESDYQASDWGLDSLNYGQNIFEILESEGAQTIRSLAERDPVPYAFIFQKGIGPRDERIAENLINEINVSTVLKSLFTSSNLTSKLIGPASKWKYLSWNVPNEMITQNDTLNVSLIGFQPDGSQDTLFHNLPPEQSLESINPKTFPFLKLGYKSKDLETRDPAFLEHWTLTYDGVPELAINPSIGTYYFQADTLQQGLELQLKATVENLSIYPTDSIEIQFKILNPQNQEQTFQQKKAGLAGNEQTSFEFTYPTNDLEGLHNLTTEVNPDKSPVEHYYFNNVLNQNFEVLADQKNPLLDVTFDGRVLLNGDLVGSNPLITVRLKDENPYLLLSDTSLVALQLKTPDGRSQRISMNSPEVQFSIATQADKNELSIEYQPTFTEDGTYQLTVNGQDVSGNFSGIIDYQVEFEVRTRNSISNVLNYPNPFSTSTQFVYTLTGSPPTFFKIQILNVSGRVVREITQDEIGPLQVGTHRTDYTWNGTDEYGDRLANGVYLYRIIAKDENGQDFESYDNYVEDTGLAGFFEKGFGKMVLLR